MLLQAEVFQGDTTQEGIELVQSEPTKVMKLFWSLFHVMEESVGAKDVRV